MIDNYKENLESGYFKTSDNLFNELKDVLHKYDALKEFKSDHLSFGLDDEEVDEFNSLFKSDDDISLDVSDLDDIDVDDWIMTYTGGSSLDALWNEVTSDMAVFVADFIKENATSDEWNAQFKKDLIDSINVTADGVAYIDMDQHFKDNIHKPNYPTAGTISADEIDTNFDLNDFAFDLQLYLERAMGEVDTAEDSIRDYLNTDNNLHITEIFNMARSHEFANCEAFNADTFSFNKYELEAKKIKDYEDQLNGNSNSNKKRLTI